MAKKKIELELPLPPSVNKAKAWNPYIHRFVPANSANDYYQLTVPQIIQFCRKNDIKPIEEYIPVKIKWWLRTRNADSHNFEKVLFDALEKGGLFKNDKYIMSQTIEINFDYKNPRAIIIV